MKDYLKFTLASLVVLSFSAMSISLSCYIVETYEPNYVTIPIVVGAILFIVGQLAYAVSRS